jgi:hypothetical protein
VTSIEPWRRTSFQSGGAQNVFQLFVFSPGALKADVEFSISRFGLPSKDAMAFVEVRELPREVDSAWFDGFRSGSLRGLATDALHGDIALLDAATQLTAVMVARADADDLTHLQAGWAVTQWLIARGATVVLDAQTNRFWRGDDVAAWPAGRPFTLTSDVNIVVEAEPTSPTANIHTRGLQKFGRPDLVVRDVPGDRWDAVAGLVRVVSAMLVDGMIIKPGDSKTIDGQTISFRELKNDDLHLNNAGLELTA